MDEKFLIFKQKKYIFDKTIRIVGMFQHSFCVSFDFVYLQKYRPIRSISGIVEVPNAPRWDYSSPWCPQEGAPELDMDDLHPTEMAGKKYIQFTST